MSAAGGLCTLVRRARVSVVTAATRSDTCCAGAYVVARARVAVVAGLSIGPDAEPAATRRVAADVSAGAFPGAIDRASGAGSCRAGVGGSARIIVVAGGSGGQRGTLAAGPGRAARQPALSGDRTLQRGRRLTHAGNAGVARSAGVAIVAADAVGLGEHLAGAEIGITVVEGAQRLVRAHDGVTEARARRAHVGARATIAIVAGQPVHGRGLAAEQGVAPIRSARVLVVADGRGPGAAANCAAGLSRRARIGVVAGRSGGERLKGASEHGLASVRRAWVAVYAGRGGQKAGPFDASDADRASVRVVTRPPIGQRSMFTTGPDRAAVRGTGFPVIAGQRHNHAAGVLTAELDAAGLPIIARRPVGQRGLQAALGRVALVARAGVVVVADQWDRRAGPIIVALVGDGAGRPVVARAARHRRVDAAARHTCIGGARALVVAVHRQAGADPAQARIGARAGVQVVARGPAEHRRQSAAEVVRTAGGVAGAGVRARDRHPGAVPVGGAHIAGGARAPVVAGQLARRHVDAVAERAAVQGAGVPVVAHFAGADTPEQEHAGVTCGASITIVAGGTRIVRGKPTAGSGIATVDRACGARRTVQWPPYTRAGNARLLLGARVRVVAGGPTQLDRVTASGRIAGRLCTGSHRRRTPRAAPRKRLTCRSCPPSCTRPRHHTALERPCGCTPSARRTGRSCTGSRRSTRALDQRTGRRHTHRRWCSRRRRRRALRGAPSGNRWRRTCPPCTAGRRRSRWRHRRRCQPYRCRPRCRGRRPRKERL